MYSQPYHPKSPNPRRPKTPKSEGNSLFHMPSPLSPTFITTQSLTKVPVQRKKERVLSPSKHGSTQLLNTHLANHGYHTKQSVSVVSVIPMDDVETSVNKSHSPHDRNRTPHEMHRVNPYSVNRAQVCMPGDHVVIVESPGNPGIPIVYRPEEEQKNDPDKLNLDRRKLSVCPILEGEENLRLLNYQHNNIKKIENLSMLTKLIFLDLYDNQIEEMSGLSSLKLLRVLMLGKNKVRRITNLQELIMLDVLDLHGNNIKKIENVDHLRHLRVLNLAGNQLSTVENLAGLSSLSELNLRRNSIHTVNDIGDLPCLQRLFLSFNNIKSFHSVDCLSKSLSLIELSLDGNPFSKSLEYKQSILQNVINLRQLDMKRLTDEEKRFACITAKREEEKRKEQERLTSMKEKRRIAISNAQRQWNQQSECRIEESQLPSLNSDSCEKIERKSPFQSVPKECFSVDACPLKVVDRVKSLSASHLAEVDNNSLNLYGHGSLEALDKDWGEKTHTSINTINFNYINFQDIKPFLPRLCHNFPSLSSLKFDMTNIATFSELNSFSALTCLDHLQILPAGNSVTKLSLWESYTIFCLSHLKLSTLNDKEISNSDVLHAECIFGPISQIMTSKLPNYRTKMTKSIQNTHPHLSTFPLWLFEENHDEQSIMERKQFSSSYISEIVHNALLGDRKIRLLEECWDTFLEEIVTSCLAEMKDLDDYCDISLGKIKKSMKMAID